MSLLSILYATALVESIVTVIKNIKNRKDTSGWYWASLIASISISVLVTYNWDLDLFSWLLGVGKIPLVGAVLTGFIVARGSNVVHSLIDTLEGFRERFRNPSS